MEGALAAYQEAARLDPSVPAVHHNIGLMLMRLGRFGQAVQPFVEALRLIPATATRGTTSVMPIHNSAGMTRRSIPGRSFSNWCPAAQRPSSIARGTTCTRDSRARPQRPMRGASCGPPAGAIGAPRSWCWWHTWGYRQSGAEARGILDEAAARLNTTVWPYPVVAYMRGELTADRLMENRGHERPENRSTYVCRDGSAAQGPSAGRTRTLRVGTRLRQQALH